jgi:hypothetical protein
MAAGKQAPEVRTFPPLDAQISGVLKKARRFRAGFAEHLAFWVRLADAAVSSAGLFAMARPNTQPEDKGHDGLIFEVGQQSSQAELQSVKNSIAKAKPLVSTAGFRNKGVATAGAQLDDFWLVQNNNIGFVRLEQMLSEVTTSLGLTPDAIARQALLAQCAFNAVVFADPGEGTHDLFDGYQHVTQSALGRVATFVGANTWKETAAAVQDATLAILAAKGLG